MQMEKQNIFYLRICLADYTKKEKTSKDWKFF